MVDSSGGAGAGRLYAWGMSRIERKRRKRSVRVDRVYDGDVYVRVNSVGSSGDRSFILIPGIGVSSTYFERLAPHLNEFGPVHALDLPGFGGVPHPSSTLTIREYADLVGRVIDELDLKDPIIVGHSMGSQVVSDLVSRRPELSTLILIGPVVVPGQRRVLTQAVRFLQSSWHEPLTVKVLAVSAYVFCGFKWFSRVLPEMLTYPIEEALPKVRAHTLVIRGEYDAVAPREWVERVGELLPSSRLWEIPGAAHSVMYAHAEEVAKLCVDHARRTVADGDDDRLQVYPEDSDGSDDKEPEAPQPAAIIQAVGGRIEETIGIVTDDDDRVAEGKSQVADAVASIDHD
ncbi:Pimeloyl-ACP methyl ester carboxylesterase [Plantibacter flavus]|uniref:Pimeloyl-ACP methyl ester carboxylesterase n=2 Tax=Plantibacter flavus TaxID=150123 RepID=A0A3N2BYY8_9MICO|nr:pimeloyl-ACP methyl ester carboxylesterase [Plantibacter flavus]SMG34096.1 Pimeloyl-ACP methyl ester carboxylesterase [Plantibacter flavus]